MCGRGLLVGVFALVLIVSAASAPRAAADGDPASDVLYTQRAFLPYDVAFPPRTAQQLKLLLLASSEAGYPIRVAIVASAYDLGSVGVLWRRPQTYARFLGAELSLVYHGLLLVVMPSGFGVSRTGHPVPAATRELEGVTIGRGGHGLAQSAIVAVRRLAHAAGRPLTLPRPVAGPAPSVQPVSHARRNAIIVAAGLLLVALVWLVSVRLRPIGLWRRGASHSPPRRFSFRPSRFSAFWLLVLAIGLPLLAADILLSTTETHAARPVGASRPSAGPDATWGRGQVRAPSFTLVDESGQPITQRSRSGGLTIVTFIDPICRNYCPLEAKVLDHAVASLQAAQRPRIVAVSVDPAEDTPRNVRLDRRKWHLTSSWHWAFGAPGQLARVWRGYKVAVQVIPQTAAGITIKKIVHTEAAYVIDANGYQRALFLWPFTAATVAQTVKQVAATP
jgi:cytochrome oxidase Cu insertion factor (SCO1/SenC/PrrC family)